MPTVVNSAVPTSHPQTARHTVRLWLRIVLLSFETESVCALLVDKVVGVLIELAADQSARAIVISVHLFIVCLCRSCLHL